MSTEYRGSYRGRDKPDPAMSDPVGADDAVGVVNIAAALERLTTTVADFGIFIEHAVADEELDSITVTVFDRRRRNHRTHEARNVSATYSQGFDPPLTAIGAAQLIVVEIASSP